MNGSAPGCIRLFQVSGITVLLHWSWLLVAAYQISDRAQPNRSLAWSVAEYLTLFGIVLLHEFGHVFACRSVGGQADRIVLWPLGGLALVQPPPRPGALLWSIAAGPLVNVVLVPVTVMLSMLANETEQAPELCSFLSTVWKMNVGLLVLNLLPIYPLDGGQILQALLWFVIGRVRSLLVAGGIGMMSAVVIAGVAIIYFQSIWWFAIALFIGMQAFAGVRLALKLREVSSAEEYLGQAKDFADREAWDDALAACSQALAQLPLDHPARAEVLGMRAAFLGRMGDWERAIANCDEALRLRPDLLPCIINRGFAHLRLGHYANAEDDFKDALRLDPDNISVLNNLAWLKATCPHPAFRDGQEAVRLATRACELTGWNGPNCIGTLSAAKAETGDFDAAITYQKEALKNSAYAASVGDEARARIRLYEARTPYRERADASAEF